MAEDTAEMIVNIPPGLLNYAVLILIPLVLTITPIVLRRRQHEIRQTRVRQIASRYRVTDLMDFLPQESEARNAGDFYRSYSVSTFVLAIVVALHVAIGLVVSKHEVSTVSSIFLASSGLDTDNRYVSITLMAIVGAFLGSFVWAAGYIYRRLASYDLTPTTYFQVALRMLSGTMVAVALRHVLPMIFSNNSEFFLSLVILTAFVCGYEPWFGVGYLRQWAEKSLSRHGGEEKPMVPAKKLPVDYIDGISPYIKTRLEEFEIDDVQNLATENPITLYARTPFGLTEIVDWIAQAQLYQLLSLEKVQTLKGIGVRNIFHFRAQALANTKYMSVMISEEGQVQVTTEYVRVLAHSIEGDPSFVFIERLAAAMGQRGRWRVP